MGLDQYGFVRQKDHAQAVEFYWRKHSRLQEFMQALWADTVDGEDGEEFNCRELTLTKDDLQDLQGQIAKGYEDYVSRGGFFWGHQWQDQAVDHYAQQDAEFVAAALDALEQGGQVEYSCWY
jgi:hypothetical protein